MITVLVADDDDLLRAGIVAVLSTSDIAIVGVVADGLAAVETCVSLGPDVAVLDVRMPGIDGVEATRRILAAAPTTAVLILTGFNVDEAVFEALRAGARGFLLKDAASDELVAAVRALAGGDGWLNPALTRRLIEEFVARPGPGRPSRASLSRLTPKEREVFAWLGHGLSNAEIAARLYVSESTVKTHVSRVLAELGLRDRVQAAIAAHQAGFVPPDGPPPPSAP